MGAHTVARMVANLAAQWAATMDATTVATFTINKNHDGQAQSKMFGCSYGC